MGPLFVTYPNITRAMGDNILVPVQKKKQNVYLFLCAHISYVFKKLNCALGSIQFFCVAGESSTPLGQFRHSPSDGSASGEEKHCGNPALASGEEKQCGNPAPDPFCSSPVSSIAVMVRDGFVISPGSKRIRYAENLQRPATLTTARSTAAPRTKLLPLQEVGDDRGSSGRGRIRISLRQQRKHGMSYNSLSHQEKTLQRELVHGIVSIRRLNRSWREARGRWGGGVRSQW